MRDPANLAADFGPDALVQAYDAEDRASPKDWVAKTFDRFGRIDGLVNNAGRSLPSALVDLEDDEATIDTMWQVNVKGPLRLIRAAWPHLQAAGNGRVVNMSSLSGKRVLSPNLGYALSKYAVMGLTHSVREAGWDDGIRAAAICPSFVNTSMAHAVVGSGPNAVAGEAMTQPEDIAALVATLLALPNNAVVPELTVNWRYEAGY